MKKTTNYVSPEVQLLQMTGVGILCASQLFDSEQNESIIENPYNW